MKPEKGAVFFSFGSLHNYSWILSFCGLIYSYYSSCHTTSTHFEKFKISRILLFEARKRALCFFALGHCTNSFCQLPFARKGGENISERLSKQKDFSLELAPKFFLSSFAESTVKAQWGKTLITYNCQGLS